MADISPASQAKEEHTHYLSPHAEGYKDRKMAKWMGFILSDHMESILENKGRKNRTVVRKDKQASEKISRILKKAFDQNQIIAIQLDYIYDGEFEEDIEGIVAGFDGTYIHIKTARDFITLNLDVIHHVEAVDSIKWYLK